MECGLGTQPAWQSIPGLSSQKLLILLEKGLVSIGTAVVMSVEPSNRSCDAHLGTLRKEQEPSPLTCWVAGSELRKTAGIPQAS